MFMLQGFIFLTALQIFADSHHGVNCPVRYVQRRFQWHIPQVVSWANNGLSHYITTVTAHEETNMK
jgi:hypothetical protein